MTAMATCDQCTYCFSTHTNQPVTPPHLNPGTGHMCPGADKPAIPGVTS